MPDYPILLQLENRLCLVVGAGCVGMRKVRGLLDAGARVRLVEEGPPPVIEDRRVELLSRPFRPDDDLDGVALAFAATGDRRVNDAVAAAARSAGVPVNVADRPGSGDFTLPALLRRGDLTVSVSTAGGSPALAALLRDRLRETVGPEWQTLVDIAAALRRKRLTSMGKNKYNQAILYRLLEGDLPALIAAGRRDAVDRHLETLFGEGFSLAALGVRLPKETP